MQNNKGDSDTQVVIHQGCMQVCLYRGIPPCIFSLCNQQEQCINKHYGVCADCITISPTYADMLLKQVKVTN